MDTGLATTRGPEHAGAWALRIEAGRVAIVLGDTALPGGARLDELAIHLPHVRFPFDFQEGIERFRHHRGEAEVVRLSLDARVLADQVHAASDGRLVARAVDDGLVLLGRTPDGGARFTVRARCQADAEGASDAGTGEPTLLVSLYDIRVYGAVEEPWPVLAGSVLDLIPDDLVVERTLTTVRVRLVRRLVTWALSGLGWKLPVLQGLRPHGVELRAGRFAARFVSPSAPAQDREATIVPLDAVADDGYRASIAHFVEDLELKRHHGQIDELLHQGRVREAVAEIYRALDGPLQPGFLAERLIGISAARPILHDECVRSCRALLAGAPDHVAALAGLAAVALAGGRSQEAAVQLERLSEILAHGPEREDATAVDLTLAELLRDLDAEGAQAALQRVLDRAPDHEEALEQLIALAESRGREAEALPLYKRLLFSARSPARTREAGLRLARHALARHAPDDARVFLRVILEASPRDAEARLALAQVEEAEGHVDEAIAVLEGALRALPPGGAGPLVRVVLHLAGLRLRTGDAPRARRVLWRAVDADPLAPEDALALGRAALDADEADLAARYAEAVSGADDDTSTRAGCLLGRAHLARGAREAALRAVVGALERSPGDEEALSLVEPAAAGLEIRERLLFRLRQSAEASEGPARARMHRALGRLYESMDLAADAIAPYEVAFDAAGRDDASVAGRLMVLYERFGMWPRHESLCRALLARCGHPLDRVPLLLRLGRTTLREVGDPVAARILLTEAADLAPRRVEGLVLLREALEADPTARPEAAVPVLRRLAAVHPEPEKRREATVRLAEVLLDELDTPGEAAAVVAELPREAHEPQRVRNLRRRLAATRAQAPAPPPEGYDAAVGLADVGRSAEALAVLERLLVDHPEHVPAQELAAVLRGALAAAAPAPGDPGLPPAVAERLGDGATLDALLEGAIAKVDEAPDEALTLADRALALDPDCVEALEVRARVLHARGDWEEVVDALQRLSDLAFDARQTLAYLREEARVVERGLSDRRRAADIWARYAEYAPLDDGAHAWLADWYRDERQWVALADLEARRADAAVESALDADDPEGLHRLRARARLVEGRVCLTELQDHARAVQAAEDGLLGAPEDPELLEVLVRGLAALNERIACREAIDRLLPQLLDGPLKEEMLLLRGA